MKRTLTRVTTVEITEVFHDVDENLTDIPTTEETKLGIRAALMDILAPDGVVVAKVEDFLCENKKKGKAAKK